MSQDTNDDKYFISAPGVDGAFFETENFNHILVVSYINSFSKESVIPNSQDNNISKYQ